MTSPTGNRATATPRCFTRRRALSSVATVGVTLPLLAACADDETTMTTAIDPKPEALAPTSQTAVAPNGALTSTADIPLGGGVVFADSRVVVTQPDAGSYQCFSAVCTHTGCIVTGVTSTILCACHGSSFDISTGEALAGPAVAPLSAVAFTIDKDQVVLS